MGLPNSSQRVYFFLPLSLFANSERFRGLPGKGRIGVLPPTVDDWAGEAGVAVVLVETCEDCFLLPFSFVTGRPLVVASSIECCAMP